MVLLSRTLAPGVGGAQGISGGEVGVVPIFLLLSPAQAYVRAWDARGRTN
jgi:hypothetical protein